MEPKYKGVKKWKDGTRQELIPEKGETVADAAKYMRDHLELFGMEHLTFDQTNIETVHGKYYITLYEKR